MGSGHDCEYSEGYCPGCKAGEDTERAKNEFMQAVYERATTLYVFVERPKQAKGMCSVRDHHTPSLCSCGHCRSFIAGGWKDIVFKHLDSFKEMNGGDDDIII